MTLYLTLKKGKYEKNNKEAKMKSIHSFGRQNWKEMYKFFSIIVPSGFSVNQTKQLSILKILS